FVLSQDQTLHKKGREKPKPRQTDKPNRAPHGLAIQKLHKEKIQKPTPNPTGIYKEAGPVRRF
ncbi:hypothetical protein ACUY29_05810, partial [Corynebacterium aurimucosum]